MCPMCCQHFHFWGLNPQLTHSAIHFLPNETRLAMLIWSCFTTQFKSSTEALMQQNNVSDILHSTVQYLCKGVRTGVKFVETMANSKSTLASILHHPTETRQILFLSPLYRLPPSDFYFLNLAHSPLTQTLLPCYFSLPFTWHHCFSPFIPFRGVCPTPYVCTSLYITPPSSISCQY